MLVAITNAGCNYECWLQLRMLIAITNAGCNYECWLQLRMLVAITNAGEAQPRPYYTRWRKDHHSTLIVNNTLIIASSWRHCSAFLHSFPLYPPSGTSR